MRTSRFLMAFAAAALFAVPAYSADQPAAGQPHDPAIQNQATPPIVGHNATNTGEKVGVATAFPVKNKLVGLNVRNPQGEKLGSVEDVVIDLKDGKVHYLAMSFGGVLGIGSKYFAVPLDQVRFNHGKEEMYFVIDVPKEKLEKAPGFDKNDWPDFADPNWKNQIDTYYRTNTTGTANRTIPGAAPRQ